MSAPPPLHSPDRLLTVSVQPRFLRHSGPVGWQGALFTEVLAAPSRVIDHVHRYYCLQRTHDPIRERCGSGPWRTLPVGWALWRPEEEQRAAWEGCARAQFLFLSPARVEQALGSRPASGGAARWQLPQEAPLVQRLLDAMAADLATGSPAGPVVGDCLVTALCVALFHPARPARKVGGLAAAAHRRVLERIEHDLDQPLGLADLAAEVGLGVRQFCRAFRASTGASPHQYVLARRIARAQRLIASGGSLAEVALQCGFSDQSQLTRLFTRRVGLSPAAYRRTLQC